MNKSMRHIIENSFLLVLILLNIFDFFQLLPGDLDYIKKIISWTLIAYLFYRIDLPRMLFGKSSSDINFLIIISYILLAFKKFTLSIFLISEEANLLRGFFDFVVKYGANIEEFGFIMGGIILLLLSVYMGIKFDINKKSLMGIIHESGKAPKHIGSIILRTVTIFLVLSSFFIILFDLIIEWLAIAVDAPIVMLVIVAYIFHVIRMHKKQNMEKILHKIGEFGEDFYGRFIDLFKDRKKVFAAISGLLVLHLLIDLGIFIVPFITGFFKPVYFGFLDESMHQSIYSLMISDLQTTYGLFNITALVGTYLLNSIAIIFLLFIPAYIWSKALKEKKIKISNSMLGFFIASITALIISPVFKISSPQIGGSVLVDIQTMNAVNPLIGFISALAVFFIVTLLSKIKLLKKSITVLSIALVNVFAGVYVYFFFTSIAEYYIRSILFLITQMQYFIALYFLIFFSIIMMFYFVGMFSLIRISYCKCMEIIRLK